MKYNPGWRRIATRQWLLGLLVYSTALVALQAEPTTSYLGLDFFEGPEDRPQNPTFQRIFDTDQARYLWCRIHVDNLRHNQGSNPVEFRIRYYNTEGNEFLGEASVSYTLPSTWGSAYLYGGWGYSNPGRWKPGTYRVEVYAYDPNQDYNDFRKGYKLFRTQFLRLASNPGAVSLDPDPNFSVYAIEFFEGGRTFPEERSIKDTFKVSQARTIYSQARLINHQFGEADLSATLKFRYLRADGSELANPSVNMNAKKDWKTIRTSTGWGWGDTDPGNWTPGTYRVLVSSGDLLLGEGSFSVVDDRPLSLDYAITDMGVFAADGTGPLNPQYGTGFLKEGLVALHVDFTVENPNVGVREHETEFRLKLLRYVGFEEEVVSEELLEATFFPSQSDKTLTTPLNPGEEKTWEAGRYGVEIYLGDRLLGIRYFRVEDEGLETTLAEPPQPEKPDLPVAFKSMKLFEGVAEFKVPEESDYTTEFFQNETRYLWVDLFLTKLDSSPDTLLLPVTLKFIEPEGSLFQEVKKSFSIKSDMESPIVTTAYGFDEPGGWPPGKWRVEAWVEDIKIGEQGFLVLASSP